MCKKVAAIPLLIVGMWGPDPTTKCHTPFFERITKGKMSHVVLLCKHSIRHQRMIVGVLQGMGYLQAPGLAC